MLRLAMVLLLSGGSLINASPAYYENEASARFVFYYGPSYYDSKTYELSQGSHIPEHSNFDSSKKTVMYVPSYLENSATESVRVIVEAYLKNGDYNVIVLDWSNDEFENYQFRFIPRVMKIGNHVSKALLRMFDAGFNVDQFHLVGFSVGAHLAGHIGREIKRRSGNNVFLERISGLDPLYYGFYSEGQVVYPTISKYDAKNVDIIHTDGYAYGLRTSAGTVDFWPNGGEDMQVGCPQRDFENFSDIELCSHNRAWQYWAESVANRFSHKFVAAKAQNWSDFKNRESSDYYKYEVVMGAYTPNGLSGNYYFQTNAKAPFARGYDGLKYNYVY